MAPRQSASGTRTIASNRRARHDYEILQTWEAGLVLLGTEVKALRAGRASLGDAFAELRGGEIWLCKMHIGPYEQASRENHDPFRRRKLLLKRGEIRRIAPRIEERGLTLVPLRVYFKHGLAKVEVALARGKKQYDKRQDKAKQETERRMQKHLGRREKAT
jgi:SsrA-binding protein